MTRSGSGPTLEALPIPSSQLDRYRLRLRQRDRGTVAGAHLIRQRGQSLEFREFRPYLPGDDIRHVDWRASARHHRREELVVRTFEHEVQTRVVISIDTRATMRLPEVASKLQIARWFAEAMSYIAGRSGDSVALHALERGQVVELGTSADRWRIRHALQRLTALKATSTEARLVRRSPKGEGGRAKVEWTRARTRAAAGKHLARAHRPVFRR